MKLKILAAACSVAFVGCTSPTIVKNAMDIQNDALKPVSIMNSKVDQAAMNSKVRTSAQNADALAAEQLRKPVMRFSKSTYIGSQMVPVTNDDKLPSIFRQEFSNYSDDRDAGRSVTLSTIANRIFNSTGLLVRIQPDVSSWSINDAKSNTGKPISGPGAPVQQNSSISIDLADLRYKGPLVGFLNNLTDRLGLAWEYRDNAVVIMRFVTEAHEISTIMGRSSFEMSGGQSTEGSTDGKQSAETKLFVKESGASDPFAAIEATIIKMVADIPGSTVTRADGSRKLIVKTTREMQAQIRDVIAGENATMQKQALVQFDIYSMKVNDADERGANWNVVFNALSNVYGVNIGSPQSLTSNMAGSIGSTILKGNSDTSQRLANTSVFLNMLRENGTTVTHRTVPMVALNGQWARKTQLNTESYISETTPGVSSANGGAGVPGIKTDKITTGDTYQVMVQIQNNNNIFLKLGITLSDLLGLTDQTSGVGQNQQKVQTTKVSATSDQSALLIKPGEVMAISGLSREISTGDKRSLSDDTPIIFGGSRKVGVIREHFIIFVRPVVL
ncbi:type II secretion system protein GspD [Janthinobacterium sp. MDT1-19]|uniref:type II secretion system protein GspD n=1 Tax=Janthinobacterium sp. MDT1-19 TaxID=1259339 RepID=UPI003F20D656